MRDQLALNSISRPFWSSVDQEILQESENQQSEISYPATVAYINIYDVNKAALLRSDKKIEFYTVTSDSLLYENSITLHYSNPKNFSLSRSMDYLVYQTQKIPDGGEIILRDMNSETEKILFRNEHHNQ